MLAALFLAVTLSVGPERPLSPEVNLVPAAARDPMVVSAGGKVLLAWSARRLLPPGQWQRDSARGRFLGESRDFEIFPTLPYGFRVTSDGDSFYALTFDENAVPVWRTIGPNGELGPLRTFEGAERGLWGPIPTRSQFIFSSMERIVITDHDGRMLKEVRPAHMMLSRLVPLGDDFYFLEGERHLDDPTFTVWLTRLTATGETSSELVGTFRSDGNFDLTAGGGRLLLSIFQWGGSHEQVAGLLLTPGARTPPSPELIPLVTRLKMSGGNGWTAGWDGHEFGIATCDESEGRFVPSLTRVGLDGKTTGPERIASGSAFCPNVMWTAGGKTTLLGMSYDAVNRTVAISAPSFAAMAHEKRNAEPFLTAEVVPVQHSVAFAGKLAVWSEGDAFATAIRARFLPGGRPFTIARGERRFRSGAAAVATRNGYVIAWRESAKGSLVPNLVFQQIERNGALLRRYEVPGGPFDTFTSAKPAIASSGETIALVTTSITDVDTVRLLLFDSKLDHVSVYLVAENAGAEPFVRAAFHTAAQPPVPAEGVVVWNGHRYIVAWLSNRFRDDVHFASLGEHGGVGNLADAPALTWPMVQATMRASDVVVAGTMLNPTYKVCLGIRTLAGKPLGPVHCTPTRSTNESPVDIQPILFHDLVILTERTSDAYDVLAAAIGPDSGFVCISCSTEREERPAATTIDGHTYVVAYERTDPALDGVTRLFFREVVVHDRP